MGYQSKRHCQGHDLKGKAVRIRNSAGGFGVVAHEIRKPGQRCTETVKVMKHFIKQVSLGDEAEADTLRDDFQLLVIAVVKA
jgi:methyl-accepting chemotaxis protein